MSKHDEYVALLEDFVTEDDQPTIDARSAVLHHDGGTARNLAAASAFDTDYGDEVAMMAQMNDVLKRGEELRKMLYTYRSCSKAMSAVKSNQDDARKAERYQRILDVLEPEIEKLKQVMAFKDEQVEWFPQQVLHLVKQDHILSESMIWCLIRLLDSYAQMDALKNMKASFNNDLSAYKRAYNGINTGATQSQTEIQMFGMFLATQNAFTVGMKTELHKVNGFDEIISQIANCCASWLEAERHLLPSERHCLLRVMSYSLFLMDGQAGTPHNVFRSKKVKIDRFARLFKKTPIVPLYGDMQVTLDANLVSSPNFDEKLWGSTERDLKVAKEYELLSHMSTIREEHTSYIARFSAMLDEVRLYQQRAIPQSYAQQVSDVLLEGMRLLGQWCDRVLLQSAWKYAHPNQAEQPGRDDEPSAYERAVSLNYSKQECLYLAEALGIIKGLASKILAAAPLLRPVVNSSVHYEVQAFVQGPVKEMLQSAHKKKRAIKRDLLRLRIIVGDWSAQDGPEEFIEAKKKNKKEEAALDFPRRTVGFSETQLVLMRNLLYSFIAFKTHGKKAVYSDKDLSKTALQAVEEFYDRSSVFGPLLNFADVIADMTDFGDLWYREFYLELEAKLQFPIALSLPWIVTDTILESRSPSMMELVLYPLDIYNDAAGRALRDLNCRYLFNEIEAEVNLCFDQLVYKLSDQIYGHYKTVAASIFLEETLKGSLELGSTARLNPRQSRYRVLLRQRHVDLLGRSIDLNMLLSERINNILRKNISAAIDRFEGNDLSSVIELETQLRVLKLMHSLLAEDMPLLDPFDSVFAEANKSVSAISYHSRIIFHVIFELTADVFVNFIYNSVTRRFVRPLISFGEQVERAPTTRSPNMLYGTRALNAAFAKYFERYSGYFGAEHAAALFRILGPVSMPLLLEECVSHNALKLQTVLSPYFDELMNAMPPSSKLPLYEYGTKGGIGLFSGKLVDLIQYPPLQHDVFQHFKEFGNALAFFALLDGAVHACSTASMLFASGFAHAHSSAFFSAKESAPAGPCELEQRFAAFAAADALQDAAAAAAVAESAATAMRMYRPRRVGTIFHAFAQKLSAAVQALDGEWGGEAPEEGAAIAVASSHQFYRLWSGLQYIYCSPPGIGQGASDNYDLFGDGFLWAGALIVHSLRQRCRFEVFDFSYFILNTEEAKPSGAAMDAETKGFLGNARRVKQVNDFVFSLFETVMPLPDRAPVLIPIPASDADGAATAGAGCAPGAPCAQPSAVGEPAPPPPAKREPAPPPPARAEAAPAAPERSPFPPPPVLEGVEDRPLPPPPPDADDDDEEFDSDEEGPPPPPPPRA